MIKNDSNKFYFLIILFVFVFGIFIVGKGTYSNSVSSDDIIFDYSLEIDEENKMIKFLTKNTKVLDIINKVGVTDGLSLNVSVMNSDGDIKDNTSVINTGDVLLIKINDNEFKYGLSVIADSNGDGRISLTDLAQLRRHIVGYIDDNTGTVYKKDGVYYHALDMNRDGKLSLVDFTKVSRMIVGTEEIYSIKLKDDNINLNIDETSQLEYYISPSDVTNKSVVWTSSDENVATVSNGLVRAVGEGEAVITVTTNNSNKKATAKVVVSEYDEQIKPTGTEEIKYQENKDTLKVWIELKKRSGRLSFYTTHIWVKDAYNQFKSQVPDNFGGELLNTKNLFENAVTQQKLDNKLAVGVNASGFVLKDTYAIDFYNANPKFNMTSANPLVLVNGEVKRDLAGETLPHWLFTTYGLNKEGNLVYYNYKTGDNAEYNIKLSNKIINDGVLNTFAFDPVLVYNGVNVISDYFKENDGRNVRQGICQIDRNNFVFVTDIYGDSRSGFSYEELAEYMISLGCKYGFNLDGGGSTALVYKASNSGVVNVVNPGRKVADMIYFHE